jgi:hypothetical protein
MYRIFWRKRRWISRFDAICAQREVVRTRGSQVDDVVALVERLVRMRVLAKIM